MLLEIVSSPLLEWKKHSIYLFQVGGVIWWHHSFKLWDNIVYSSGLSFEHKIECGVCWIITYLLIMLYNNGEVVSALFVVENFTKKYTLMMQNILYYNQIEILY